MAREERGDAHDALERDLAVLDGERPRAKQLGLAREGAVGRRAPDQRSTLMVERSSAT
jgi:hypothetical protein